MKLVPLESLGQGDEFRWSGTRFSLQSTERLSFEGKPYLRVVYLEYEYCKAGDRGIMPAAELVELIARCPHCRRLQVAVEEP